MEQLDIFGCLYEDYKIRKFPIKMCELFGGLGSQSKSIKKLDGYIRKKVGLSDDVKVFEHHKVCEWAVPSIIAYASIHRDELEDYGKDFTGGMNREQLANELFKLGVSLDYNEPAPIEKLRRINEKRLRLIYNSIKWEHNLVDVNRVKGGDLDIDNRVNDCIFTYSFPCQ